MAAKHFNAKAVKPGFTGYAEITDIPKSEPESSTKPAKRPAVKKVTVSASSLEKESHPEKEKEKEKENIKIAIAKLEVLAMLHPATPFEKIINDVISLLKTNI